MPYEVKVGFWPCQVFHPVVVKMWYSDALRVARALAYYRKALESDPEFRSAEESLPQLIPAREDLDLDELEWLQQALVQVARQAHGGGKASVASGKL
jgi:hypothetical protein